MLASSDCTLPVELKDQLVHTVAPECCDWSLDRLAIEEVEAVQMFVLCDWLILGFVAT